MEANSRWRSVHRQAEYNRLRKKTREHEFVERLEREFEFSPRESRGVLEVVGETFFDNREMGAGEMGYVCASAEEGPGKSMEGLKKIQVRLTREESGDRDVQARSGDGAMRKVQILRMTEEAYEQGGLLTQEDLGRVLGVSSRTIRRDVEDLVNQKVKLYLRGLQRDIGKGISHKVWIVGVYLEWKTKEIGYYIGRTERLVEEYLELIAQAEKNREQRKRLESIKSQMRHVERKIPLKKGDSGMVWRLA